MKLVYFVDTYADRRRINVDYQHMVFFAGTQPKDRSFVVIESKSLRGSSTRRVLAWMRESIGTTDKLRDVIELPETLWRPATLDDFMDAQNPANYVWFLKEAFSVEDFARFADKWHAPVMEHAHAPAAAADRKERAKRLAKLAEFADRAYNVLGRFGSRATDEQQALQEELEREKIAELQKQPFDWDAWIDLLGRLKAFRVQLEYAELLARELAKRDRSEAEVASVLDRIHANEDARALINRQPYFWTLLGPTVRFAANVRDETIDITAGVEQKIVANWDLWRGRRVGRIAPGRIALVITRVGAPNTYVRGERRLKFAAERAGGSVKRFGCTLVVKQSSDSPLAKSLLAVERIQTLANVSPESLRQEIDALGVPADHLIYRALSRAGRDPREARILADLLIEYAVGIDADIARGLARAQSVGNRQRR